MIVPSANVHKLKELQESIQHVNFAHAKTSGHVYRFFLHRLYIRNTASSQTDTLYGTLEVTNGTQTLGTHTAYIGDLNSSDFPGLYFETTDTQAMVVKTEIPYPNQPISVHLFLVNKGGDWSKFTDELGNKASDYLSGGRLPKMFGCDTVIANDTVFEFRNEAQLIYSQNWERDNVPRPMPVVHSFPPLKKYVDPAALGCRRADYEMVVAITRDYDRKLGHT